MAQVQRSDLAALRNEIDRLWAENRQLREKIATTWELVMVEFSGVTGVPSGIIGLWDNSDV